MSTEKTKPVTMLDSLDGQSPIFPVHLDLQRLDGTMVRVTIQCKAMGKRAWSRMRREHIDAVQAAEAAFAEQELANSVPTLDAPRPSVPPLDQMVDRGITRDAAFLANIADSWSLPQACDAEGLERLEDKFGGALGKLLNAYELAVYQGQLGNSAPLRAR
ncbi:hypothetical protein GmRootA79_16130 [Acidovorax sp. A79]|uniref:phage tail assembly chaperone n=1 Tax=Acidovorax sp. A79 TaxID=3056107 RepID=UPI0034E8A3A2